MKELNQACVYFALSEDNESYASRNTYSKDALIKLSFNSSEIPSSFNKVDLELSRVIGPIQERESFYIYKVSKIDKSNETVNYELAVVKILLPPTESSKNSTYIMCIFLQRYNRHKVMV
jgi:hypothetical protein